MYYLLIYYLFYKFILFDLSIILDVNLLNNGKANLLVPKSEVLSKEATLINLITFSSTLILMSSPDASFL